MQIITKEVNKMRVAIESNLTPIKDFLTWKGHMVENINLRDQSPPYLNGFDAFVVSGLNTDFMGVEATDTKAMVINADGLTPEEVANRLQSMSNTAQL